MYYSTRHKSPQVDIKGALFKSGAPDGGIYMPLSLPVIPDAFFNNFGDMTINEIAYIIADQLFGHVLTSEAIKHIIDCAIDFEVPINSISKNISVMELFHGPTLTFKDFGSRFMARLIEHLAPSIVRPGNINVVVSTTGNTGAAVANAFAGVSNCEVFILYPPSTSTLSLQRQFTTLGGNIHAIGVQGSIDDCRRLAKQAIYDPVLNSSMIMTSANSANIFRLLPQVFYMFYGISRLISSGNSPEDIIPAIPSGNLSNLTAAIIAKRMGLKCGPILAAENANVSLTTAIKTGTFERRSAVATLAYACDKGRPTNSDRLLDLYHNNFKQAFNDIIPCTVSDLDIIRSVNTCQARYKYLLDPHSAMAYHALNKHLSDNRKGLLFATAHPAKSLATMTAITGKAIDMPLQLNAFLAGRDHSFSMSPDFRALRNFIIHVNNSPS